MNKQTTIALGAMIGLGLAFSAWARPQLPVSIDAAENRAAEAFAQADTNADGELSAEEFDAARLPHPRRGMPHARRWMAQIDDAELFDALDKDADGALSREEATREARRTAQRTLMKQRAFAHLDRDESGAISEAEFSQRLQRMRELDQDGDGEISRDEFRTGMCAQRQAG